MKNPKVYQTNHPVSQEICHYLMEGFDAQLVPAVTLLSGLAICYGILRGTGDIIKQAAAKSRPYIYVDHAYFGKYRRDRAGRDHCYYRLVVNGRYSADQGQPNNADRFRNLSLEVRPWRTNGRHIVVIPRSGFVAEFTGENANEWLEHTMKDLSLHTDRDILIKPKDADEAFDHVIKDAWAVVAHDSMAAVDAALAGIPVFTTRINAASPIANFNLSDIETPRMPDRENWLYGLANQQFTLKEIEDGRAKERLYR